MRYFVYSVFLRGINTPVKLKYGSYCMVDIVSKLTRAVVYANSGNFNFLEVLCQSIYVQYAKYSRTSMARTSLGPWKFVRDMGSSSH